MNWNYAHPAQPSTVPVEFWSAPNWQLCDVELQKLILLISAPLVREEELMKSPGGIFGLV